MKNKNFKKIICAVTAFVLAVSLGLTGSLLVRNDEAWADEKDEIDSAVSSVTGALSKENEPISLGDGETMYVIQNADGSVSKAIASEDGKFTTQDINSYTQPIDVEITYLLDGKEISANDLAGKSGNVTIKFSYTNNDFKDDLYVPYLTVSGLILDDDIFSNVTVSHGKAIDDGSRTIAGGIALPGMKYNLDPNGTIEDVQQIPDYVEINADVTDFSLSMTISLAMPLDFSQISLSSFDGLDTIGSDLDTLVAAVNQLCDGADQLADGTSSLASGAGTLASGASSLSSGLGTISSNSSTLRAGSKTVFESLLSTVQSQLKAAGLDELGITVPTLTISNYDEVMQKIIDALDPNTVYETIYSLVPSATKETVKTLVTAAVKEEVTKQVQEAVIAQAGIQGVTTWAQYQQAVAAGLIPEAVQQTIQTAVDTNVAAKMASEDIQATINAKVKEQIMSSSEVQEKIAAAAAGREKVVAAKGQLDSYNTFYQGIGSYTGGTDQAAAGASSLSSGAKSLSSGANQVNDGAAQISSGLNQLNEEGISKLTSMFGDDLANALSRFSKVIDLGKEASSTKYVMRSAAIK